MDLLCSAEGTLAESWIGRDGWSYSAAAGPVPAVVVEEVAEACRAWRGGNSILSLSFTSAAYRDLQEETEACLRRLLGIPAHFRVLFMHGGATTQFAAVPLNLLGAGRGASYVDSGHWSRRAIREALPHGEVRIAARATQSVPDPAGWRIDPRSAYCHITTNETAEGLQFAEFPAMTPPLVADMTSDFLTRPLDFSRLALGYAGMQKTTGVPGLTIVIVREDLLGRARPVTPRVLDYTAQASAASRINTPPVFSIFVAHRMLDWIEREGGVAAMAAAAARRSAYVYHVVDESAGFYETLATAACRSRVTPCLRLVDETLTGRFLAEAEEAGLRDLRGHAQVGGIRAGLYAGLPEAAVIALMAFLDEFRRTRG